MKPSIFIFVEGSLDNHPPFFQLIEEIVLNSKKLLNTIL